MDVRDLNILDWVLWDNTPCQVTAIGCDYIETTKCGITLAESHLINPIPLTAEILEKNGFKYSMPHNDWTNADCNFYLYEGGNGYRIQNTDIKLDYVHHLQHLLRLCNLEKKIEL